MVLQKSDEPQLFFFSLELFSINIYLKARLSSLSIVFISKLEVLVS